MGQIGRRKKKGRPSKADLARRSGESQAAEKSDIRRSLRRRNVRYNIIDYDDDYLDEDEDERRREKKKLKLVDKLNSDDEEEEEEAAAARGEGEDDAEEEEDARADSRAEHALEEDEEGGDVDEIEGGEENEDAEDEEEMVKGRKVDLKGLHCASGTPTNPPSGIPLPDKRTLELILDKLQKKDTYGVFAEPVDPEELPDYHDVIEHPMDFATVRKKLANGSYPTLEQFESDVFLICSNAMQYNAPETIYHKQARSIQEQGRKKFEKLRIDFERSQAELKLEQKTRAISLVKKQGKKPLGRASQEPIGSDFSSGATLATINDVQPTSFPMQGGSCERPGLIDGILEANAFMIDATQEKAEDILPGRGLLSKMGRRSLALDEDRRASYNMANQPITRSDSIFMTFESEPKHLVTVGLHAEYSYARSLARFSASLGPVAWKVASHKIQQALPAGCKFGRGWVGEYEPLPTPVLMFGNRMQKDDSLVTRLHCSSASIKGDKNCRNVEPTIEHHGDRQVFQGKQIPICPPNGLASEGKPSLFGSGGIRPNAPVDLNNQQKNVPSRNFGKSENQFLKQVELNSAPSMNENNSSSVAKFPSNASPTLSKPREMVSRNMNTIPSVSFKQPDTNGVVSGELPNGKVMNPNSNRQVTYPSSESTSNQAGRAPPLVHGKEQSVSDPVQLMRMFAERTQKQQVSNHSPGNTPPVTPSDRSVQRDDSANASAAAAAARAWMSVGAGGFKQVPDNSSSPKSQISAYSLYNPTRELHQHMSQIRGNFPPGAAPFQSDKNNFPFQAFVPQAAISPFPNRPMVIPQLASADLSRFQMQSHWRGPSPPSQPRQKQETLPPDLNIGFQSPGSPAKQSSGVIDSQQPDLALQL
ncbi:hypothetical protein HN51_061648 [Arachis hypogaea]|uniref:Bromo domain-containing protein n=1 Tax=Arachis hypogaea TaxID=3818 RepID=A0A445AP39_ARAHY|nr:uncharacterized protein LOC112720266 [Arachis hypogaea]QHO18954.1 Bromodomain and PHD finger-containing protein [Arachis hypogaea]RYR28206.1 hypothetical protein Ahy_B01g052323 [Arachis hypogaea]